HLVDHFKEFFPLDSRALQIRNIQLLYKRFHFSQKFSACLLVRVCFGSCPYSPPKIPKSFPGSGKGKAKTLFQEHGIGQPMGYMEQCPYGTAHTMDNGHRRIIKSYARFQRRQSHLLSGFLVYSLPVCYGQISEITLYLRKSKRIV